MPRPKSAVPKSQQEINAYQNNYNSAHYETFRVNYPKEEHLIALIDAAVEGGAARSRQAYILAAVRAALRRDGMLPEE